ncbi:hypothetical protein GKG47_09680 [Lactonifactor sp. BIOML-A3]|uniref:hypothetical protein n=1 Tax=unclassified Lactonifactor TaxID=2636670 RepID=UPI0012AFCAC3|nr:MULTISPECIES: hypothetical protein [unclassified Lactonifactor]MSA01768.1 hypothetical protein [Lactonifactor sp. BIOML-A5]MSA08282.1 hypothetical protein [Lactonifactor sp. BIOML-A4]MSA12704.1 hypothetical protein [Lactonifactor sp. BIOML-A3]MSA17344.1 hypothetical protein [Lactonifactor sp. BIOML-A2]MSA37921.1 hypothetical protein [Lactonifactor sp. BIOML-A1]
MKAFLEEYGIIIIVAIIALLMVVLATPLGQYIGTAIAGTVTDFINESGITNPPTWTNYVAEN